MHKYKESCTIINIRIIITNIGNKIDTTIYNTQYIHIYVLYIIILINNDNGYTKEDITKTDKQ